MCERERGVRDEEVIGMRMIESERYIMTGC